MGEFGDALRAEMAAAGFRDMDAVRRYRFIAEFVMRRQAGAIEAARRRRERERTAYYLSAEFLLGRIVGDALRNLGVYEETAEAMAAAGASVGEWEDIPDHALGNGGLGRLAACFLDSAATTGVPLCGYGIRYRYGLFRQDLSAGYQREEADDWMRVGDPWSVRRADEAVAVSFARQRVLAVPYDMPVFGFGGVTLLRLWQAEAEEPFDFARFDAGRYPQSVAQRERAERISAVLYPNDETEAGRELRLMQQYFFSDASVEDILRRAERAGDVRRAASLAAVQLNDTHPTLAIPAWILRLEARGVPFEEALAMAREVFSYTNHTVMREALEVWDASLLRRVIPDAYRVIERIEERLAAERTLLGMDAGETAILADGRVHMANLASYVCHAINGVAALHTEILQRDVLHAWYAAYPDKFSNKTNGITQRRWLLTANPPLAAFVTERIGDGWVTDAGALAGLRPAADDAASLAEFARVKAENKRRLADILSRRLSVSLDPAMVFDMQCKRLHEYKRQLMNAFSILYLYRAIKDGEYGDLPPAAFFFAAKSAPGYRRAKGIIRYILALAETVNGDPATRERLRVVFVPDYSVSWAEKLVAAGDISEQISMAGTEASGTGNMKFMLNGAPTLGTFDGANIEIAEAAGAENNYFFGPDAAAMEARMREYDPRAVLAADARLAGVVDSLTDGTFSDGGSGVFAELRASLLEGASWHRADNYCVLGDFASYLDAKTRALRDTKDARAWARRGLLNTAAAGRFSSDRTVREYARDIWRV